MYSVITLQGAGGWMPNLNTRNVPARTRTDWKSFERNGLIRSSLRRRGPVTLEGEEEGDQVEVLACGEGLAERGGQAAGRLAGHRPHAGRVEDLAHDVLRRLDARDLRQLGSHGRGPERAGLVAGGAGAPAPEHRPPGRRFAAMAPTPARSGARVPFWPILWQISQVPLSLKIFSPAATSCSGVTVPPPSDSSP